VANAGSQSTSVIVHQFSTC